MLTTLSNEAWRTVNVNKRSIEHCTSALMQLRHIAAKHKRNRFELEGKE